MSTEHLDIMVLVPYLQFLPDQIPRQKFTLDLELYLQFPVLRNRSLHKLQKPRFFILCLVSLPRRSNRHTKMLVLVSSLFPEMHLQERSQHILRKDSQLSVFLGNLFTQMSDLFHLQMEVEQHLSMEPQQNLSSRIMYKHLDHYSPFLVEQSLFLMQLMLESEILLSKRSNLLQN